MELLTVAQVISPLVSTKLYFKPIIKYYLFLSAFLLVVLLNCTFNTN